MHAVRYAVRGVHGHLRLPRPPRLRNLLYHAFGLVVYGILSRLWDNIVQDTHELLPRKRAAA